MLQIVFLYILGSSSQSCLSHVLTQDESCLGLMEYSVVKDAYQEKKLWKKRVKFTEKERFEIGKYAAIHGATKSVKQFKKTHKHLNFGESTARKLRDRYKEFTKTNRAVCNKMPHLQRGRPLMLGTLDEKVRHFLVKLRKKGGVVNTVVAVATAKALITRSDDEHLKAIDLNSTS